MSRDPRVDPEPGDWLRAGGFDVRIDLMARGTISVSKWREGEEALYGMFSVDSAVFREECAERQAQVIAMGIPGRGSIWGDDMSRPR